MESQFIKNIYSYQDFIDLDYPESFIKKFNPTQIKKFYPVLFPFKDVDLKNKKLLDIGCGAGIDIIYALSNGIEIAVGIDINLDELKFIEKSSCLHKINGNIETMEFKCKNFFDLVIFNGSFNQIIKKFLVLKKIKTLLKNNGKIIICDIFWCGENIDERNFYKKIPDSWNLNIGGSLTEEEFLNIAFKVNLKIINFSVKETIYPLKIAKAVLEK